MDNNYPQYKEGWGQTPRSLQDLFRQSGMLEKQSLWEAEQARREQMKQFRINQLLQMMEKGMFDRSYGPREAERYINSNGMWM